MQDDEIERWESTFCAGLINGVLISSAVWVMVIFTILLEDAP